MSASSTSFLQARRNFLTSFAGGIGGVALASLLKDDGKCVLGNESPIATLERHDPLAPKPAHFPGKVKNCIFIYLIGGPSQLDMYDPKPKLEGMHGQTLPDSIGKDARFAFIQKKTAKIVASKYKFSKHGECGMELSELLPHLSTCVDDIALVRSMHTDAFNHHPGELLMNTGSQLFGRPSIGSWLNYGLGSENQNLPGYVVLTSGTCSTAGASSWSSGFLPSNYQGTLFRNQGDPILCLGNPRGICPTVQGNTRDSLARLNEAHRKQVLDPRIDEQIQAYELAFRMQSSLPTLTNLSNETQATLDSYGFIRPVPTDLRGWEGGISKTFEHFSRNCLMARRMVESGVRFINVYHASWDHHSLLNRNLPLNCEVVDQPIAALLKDLKQRGLLDSTLVVCASEFGRTPLGENKIGNVNTSGRDHHPFAFSIWMAGAGIKPGQVLGATDEIGWNVTEDPVHVHDFHATLLHLFGLDHKRLTYKHQGRDFRLTDVSGNVVQKLLS